MVGALDLHAKALHDGDDFVTQITKMVGRGDRKISALVFHLVSAVAAILGTSSVPRSSLGVDGVVGLIGAGVEPDVVEESKWRKPSNPDGVPTFSLDGLICTVETYKDKVKATFAKGASLKDPAKLFNASLDAGTRRAIDLHEGDELDADAFKALINEAVRANRG